MCQSREFTQWYAFLTAHFWLIAMIVSTVEAKTSIARFLLAETNSFVQFTMQVHLFLAIYEGSKSKLRGYFFYLKLWAVYVLLRALLIITLLQTLNYDAINFQFLKSPSKATKSGTDKKTNGSDKGIGVSAETLAVFVALQTVFDMAYTLFLYWRLHLFYKTVPGRKNAMPSSVSEVQAERSIRQQCVVQYPYGVLPHDRVQPLYVLQGPQEMQPQRGIQTPHHVGSPLPLPYLQDTEEPLHLLEVKPPGLTKIVDY